MPKTKTEKNIPVQAGKNEDLFFSRPEAENDWFSGEGQLSCDVFQTNDSIIVKATMAGVKPENLDIAVSNDILTIRGSRAMDEEINDSDFYCRECYWGAFSRSIVLPQEVDQKKVEASLKNGVLTVKLPKKYKTTSIKVKQLDD